MHNVVVRLSKVVRPSLRSSSNAPAVTLMLQEAGPIMSTTPSVEEHSPSGHRKKKIKIDDASGVGGGRVSANSGSLAAGSRKAMTASPSGGGAAAASSGAAAGSSSAASQDTHPYARGSVIEVWHYSRKDDWWSEPDTSDEEHGEGSARTARLCDIIDRANVNNTWRYYVHYRDFNRRMDEWIGIDRILSPPSVGNAKARALKKKKQQHKTPHGPPSAAVVGGGAVTPAVASITGPTPSSAVAAEATEVLGPRSRRRTSKLQESSSAPDDSTLDAAKAAAASALGATQANAAATTPFPLGSEAAAVSGGGGAATAGTGPKAGPGGGPGGRRRRQSSRRKGDDDATVVTSNAGDGDATANSSSQGQNHAQQKNNNSIKSQQIVLSDAITTHTVGEHVVATVHAQELDEHEGLDEASLREHEEVTKVKNVNFLELGEFQMETWYFSPLPKELCGQGGFLEVLYVCEFTLNMFSRKRELRRFQSRLEPHMRHPPGNEIYRCGNLSMFEVDGLEEKIYCQNLCYIAKLFLDHKTLYFDVDPFLFYVLCESDERGYHPVGYFSKEKYSDVGFNLACILTFPAHQRKGYGRFLIAFSYELSKKEEKVGSPEKPMSDLGQQAYKPYWASTIVDFLLNQSDESRLSIMDISKKTSIMAEDIVFTLNQLGILKIINGVYFIAAEKTLLEKLAQRYPVKEPRVDPTKLHWTPFLTDVKRDKFSIHSKKPSVEIEEKKAG